MDNLITELEAATQGSRELDAEIWWDVKPSQARTAYWNGATGKPHPLIDLPHSGLGYHGVCVSAPHYTTSLDAGKTLARDEWEWRVQSNGLSAVCLPGCDYGDYSKGATPELGFVIALLRARQAMEEAA